jgi:serine/threonine protein kinase
MSIDLQWKLRYDPDMSVSQGTLSAQNLLGHRLDGKNWTVVEQLERAPCATGGNYSYGYAVDDGHGKLSFLKAFDFSSARNSPDPALAVQAMINAYVHERKVLQLCGNKGLSRVVRAIDSGMIQAPSEPGGMIFYLVFEQAEADVRSMHEGMQRLDIAWRLSILHHVSVGLNQLHLLGIARQDVKPSNILLYPALEAKLSDLGRACCKMIDTPHSEQAIAGDPDYAPPELLYGKIDPNWHQRKTGV